MTRPDINFFRQFSEPGVKAIRDEKGGIHLCSYDKALDEEFYCDLFYFLHAVHRNLLPYVAELEKELKK